VTGSARRRAWPRTTTAALLAIAAVAAVTSPVSPAVRAAVVVAFLVLGPGLAVIGLLDIPDPVRELALVIGVGLAIDTVVIGTMTYAGVGSADAALTALVALTALGISAQLLRSPGGRHSEETTS
jgi:hypothetical protein